MGDFIRARQRAFTALSPHADNRHVIIPKRAHQPQLFFAGDTFISLPDSTVISNSALNGMSYTLRLAEFTNNRYIWSSEDDVDFDRFSILDIRWGTRRGNILVNFGALSGLVVNVEYKVFMDWNLKLK